MESDNLARLLRDVAREVSKYGCEKLDKQPTVYIEQSNSLGYLIRYSGDKQHAIVAVFRKMIKVICSFKGQSMFQKGFSQDLLL